MEELEKARERSAERSLNNLYRSGPAGAGMPVAEVEALTGNLTAGWRANLPVRVVESLDELPSAVRGQVEADNAQGARGFVSEDGTVYLMAQNLNSAEDATATLYHETLGHLGLRNLFRQRLDRVLKAIYDTNRNLRQAADAWMAANPDAYTNSDTPNLRALEEVLAERAEAGRIETSIWSKIGAVIKEFGRRMGLKLAYTDSEVMAILARSHDRVISRAQPVSGEQTYARKPKAPKQPKERANIRKLKNTLATSHDVAEMNKTVGEMFAATRSGKDAANLLSALTNS